MSAIGNSSRRGMFRPGHGRSMVTTTHLCSNAVGQTSSWWIGTTPTELENRWIDKSGAGWRRKSARLHERKHSSCGFLRGDRVHATKIERAFTEKARAAFDLMPQDGACGGARASQS